mmetsp:Transcript_15319/g.37696  ORF Transcript_15319/g.37696 Transcript_15319/m.37696 type:complete len:210 (+) Transcript_15319:4599-5228(+)
MICARRVASKKATFKDIWRINMAAPPCNNGTKDFQEGGFRSMDHRASFRRISNRRYVTPPKVSEAAVATAAPTKPMPPPKMHSGSNTKFMAFVKRLTFNGVTVFSIPRYAAKPVAEMRAGTIPSARHLKYGAAKAMAGASAGKTNADNTFLGKATNKPVPKIPRAVHKKMDSHTLRWASSLSPEATADATSGAVMLGKKAMRKNRVKLA